MSTTVLIMGASGLLGQAMSAACAQRGWRAVGMSRATGVDFAAIDDERLLAAYLDWHRPDLLINAAAQTDLSACAADPVQAWRLHAALPAMLARWADDRGLRWLQVSTDHFFCGAGAARHDEHADVALVNEYARSKFAGERAALSSAAALVVRCNIVGRRGWPGRPSFAEWMNGTLAAGEPIAGYTDVWASSLEVGQSAALMLDLLETDARGLVNIGSRQPCTKAEFIARFAHAAGHDPSLVRPMARPAGALARADSMGLDVSLAERLLGRSLPDTAEVIQALAVCFEETRHATN
jgi:dTDP-4-dehydrorhamnose reductase